MPFLKLTDEGEATGPLQRLYQEARSRAGHVANIIRLMSRDPATAEASIQFYIRLMRSQNALSRARREMLATVVSCINECHY